MDEENKHDKILKVTFFVMAIAVCVFAIISTFS